VTNLVERAQAAMEALVADLELFAQLRPLHARLAVLDEQCLFIEAACGRQDPRYIEVYKQRALVRRQKKNLIHKWVQSRAASLPTNHA
jgi:hypothetical protein